MDPAPQVQPKFGPAPSSEARWSKDTEGDVEAVLLAHPTAPLRQKASPGRRGVVSADARHKPDLRVQEAEPSGRTSLLPADGQECWAAMCPEHSVHPWNTLSTVCETSSLLPFLLPGEVQLVTPGWEGDGRSIPPSQRAGGARECPREGPRTAGHEHTSALK